MGVRRFFLSAEALNRPDPYLEGEEGRHILKVLRLVPGDRVILFDGAGWEYLSRIKEVQGGRIYFSVLEKRLRPKDSHLKVVLGVPLIRPQPLEWILQKGTELGASAFHPYYSSFSSHHYAGQDLSHKMARWQRIIAEAGKHCGRNLLPRLFDPAPLDQVLKGKGAGLGIIPYEGETAYTFRDLADNTPNIEEVLACIGPEGGFNPEEIREAREQNFIPLSLGPRILRSETAALAVLTLLQFLWGDLNQKKEGVGDALS